MSIDYTGTPGWLAGVEACLNHIEIKRKEIPDLRPEAYLAALDELIVHFNLMKQLNNRFTSIVCNLNDSDIMVNIYAAPDYNLPLLGFRWCNKDCRWERRRLLSEEETQILNSRNIKFETIVKSDAK